jgi:hypothetical protein
MKQKNKIMPKVGDKILVRIHLSQIKLKDIGKLSNVSVKVTELSSWKGYFFAVPTDKKWTKNHEYSPNKDYLFGMQEIVKPKTKKVK